ncbi:hypothetical protein BDV12DRAFT_175487 [Aspergillus spectabilis]
MEYNNFDARSLSFEDVQKERLGSLRSYLGKWARARSSNRQFRRIMGVISLLGGIRFFNFK